MTTPAYGQPISIGNISTETGASATQSASLNWVKDFTKTSVGGVTGVVTNLNDTHAKTYYQNSSRGNCNNGNCVTGTDCASSNCDFQCQNCYNTSINCNNCDTQKYLQPYETGTVCNCTKNTHKYNCNCDCDCQCDFIVFDCACW
jgi:hypothetical protein